jgi:hypothetical protein
MKPSGYERGSESTFISPTHSTTSITNPNGTKKTIHFSFSPHVTLFGGDALTDRILRRAKWITGHRKRQRKIRRRKLRIRLRCKPHWHRRH